MQILPAFLMLPRPGTMTFPITRDLSTKRTGRKLPAGWLDYIGRSLLHATPPFLNLLLKLFAMDYILHQWRMRRNVLQVLCPYYAITSAATKRGRNLVPGNIEASASKCNGHRHPNGVIKGAAVFLSNKALRILANGFQRGGNAKLRWWKPLTTSLL